MKNGWLGGLTSSEILTHATGHAATLRLQKMSIGRTGTIRKPVGTDQIVELHPLRSTENDVQGRALGGSEE